MREVAVLLAGGKSSRMGQDKALLPFGGYDTLAEYQYRRLSKIFDRVYIATKVAKFDFDVPLILDRYPEASPLVALISTFETFSYEHIFFLSVDAPFVSTEVIDRLYETMEALGGDVVVASSKEGLEPLCAIYRSSILKEAKTLLLAGEHRLKTLLSRLDVREVCFEDVSLFVNLNYPNEYQSAYRLSSSI